jgi:demethylmenaquinone methyltransferase/2-methoxy-6-polyprenyl-1,4-benzoquinol methylase
MLRQAAQKLINLPRKRHAFLCRADALHLPFRNATFGAVTMAFAIRNFDNRLEALREARRVLVPGGVLVVLEAGVPETRLARLLFTIYCRYVMPTVAGALSGQRSAYCYLCESIFRFPPPRQFGRLLSEAGLELLRVHSLSFGAAKLFVASTERGESPPEAKISP